jgi:hypothetical protein
MKKTEKSPMSGYILNTNTQLKVHTFISISGPFTFSIIKSLSLFNNNMALMPIITANPNPALTSFTIHGGNCNI